MHLGTLGEGADEPYEEPLESSLETAAETLSRLTNPGSQKSQLDEPGKLVVCPSLPGVVGHIAHASREARFGWVPLYPCGHSCGAEAPLGQKKPSGQSLQPPRLVAWLG